MAEGGAAWLSGRGGRFLLGAGGEREEWEQGWEQTAMLHRSLLAGAGLRLNGVPPSSRSQVRYRSARAARRAYRTVADLWHHPDPELQPLAEEARQAVPRLGP